MNTSTPLISARNITKRFGDFTALEDANLDVAEHEVISLVGPSGSGKSTLLRCLNLLEVPEAGEIRWQGDLVNSPGAGEAEMCRHRTHLGMVFQHFNLFPHMSALDNVIEGRRSVLGESRADAEPKGRTLLERVGLVDKADNFPSGLSGGQKQRVAIARALAMEPKALLLDEVTSALDVELVSGINDLIGELAAEGMTCVVVTHDLAFAARVCQRMVFMDQGRIVEDAPPEELMRNAKDPRASAFFAMCLPSQRQA